MASSSPSPEFLAAQIRWAMSRGLPAQAAEDVVFEAWEQASRAFDPRRGAFEALMQRVVRNRCAYWWRTAARAARAEAQLPPHEAGAGREESAAAYQERLLGELSAEERRVFDAWALQKHVGKGQLTSDVVSRSIGLEPQQFENAKRRLKDHLRRLLDRFGWSPAQLLDGDDDVEALG